MKLVPHADRRGQNAARHVQQPNVESASLRIIAVYRSAGKGNAERLFGLWAWRKADFFHRLTW